MGLAPGLVGIDYIISRMICSANSCVISDKKLPGGVIEIMIHRKVWEHFERKLLQLPQGSSVAWWERGTMQFHELYQLFRAALFFAVIQFQIFFMKLAVLTVGLFNSVAPLLIVRTFLTGA
jgi:hypothetical protein